jgi:aromatic ring-opening dioxygenase LigB subunit
MQILNTIWRNAPTTMKRLKIEEDHLETISLNFAALLQKKSSVLKAMLVCIAIRGLKSFITPTNIGRSSVKLKLQISASMASTVRLLTVMQRLRLIWSTSSNKTQIFTVSTTRQFGARIPNKIMKRTSVFLLTTGKISDENLTFTCILRKFVRTGTWTSQWVSTKTDV